MSLNVNGMLSEKLECENGLRKCAQMYDFVFISECWTNEYSNVEINGFKSYGEPRERRKNTKRESGGLVVYVKENIKNGVHEEKWNNEDGMCFRLDGAFFWLERRYIYFMFVYEAKGVN